MQLPPRGYAMATAEQCDIASDFAVPRFPADSLNNCSFFYFHKGQLVIYMEVYVYTEKTEPCPKVRRQWRACGSNELTVSWCK